MAVCPGDPAAMGHDGTERYTRGELKACTKSDIRETDDLWLSAINMVRSFHGLHADSILHVSVFLGVLYNLVQWLALSKLVTRHPATP